VLESYKTQKSVRGPYSITLHVYSDTLHGFDNPANDPPRYLARVQNWYKQPTWGANVGYQKLSHMDALRRVKAFLLEKLTP